MTSTEVTPAARASRPRGRGDGFRLLGIRLQPAWFFIAPSVLIILIFIVYPITQSLWYSLFNWQIGATNQEWVGFGNYVKLFHDELFWNALRVTATFAVVSVASQLAVGYLLATALARDTWINRVTRSIFFFPTIVALTTIGLVWRFLLDPDIGLVGGILHTIGAEPIDFLQNTSLALPSVIFVSVWKNLGFTMVLLLAGLKAVPSYLYEAARIDGANARQLTWHVTIPTIRPTILFTTLILTINSLQVFDLVYVMTGGGPLFSTDTLVTQLFREGFQNFHIGYASAIAWVLFALIMIIAAFQLRLFRYNDVD